MYTHVYVYYMYSLQSSVAAVNTLEFETCKNMISMEEMTHYHFGWLMDSREQYTCTCTCNYM